AARSGATVLHVLAHGVDDPLGAGVGLALVEPRSGGTQTVGADLVATFERVPPVVVLSGCRAARDSGRLGEGGLQGLVGAFLEAGAQCVLAPMTDVELSASIELTQHLQPLLLGRALSPAEALRVARARLAEGDDQRVVASLLHAFGDAHRPVRR
ncbi:MAG: CHAT domain-containing protein, partial [Planctomycetota bacterium]